MRKTISMIYLLLSLAALFGYCRGVYKMFTCNWEPIGKAEVIYTVGSCTGLGVITGWMDIPDK